GRRLRARLARRQRQARRGRLDFRRTIRASMSSGGVPARPRFRARRPARPDLVALCDLSGSVAAASELMLGLVAPAADWFRRAPEPRTRWDTGDSVLSRYAPLCDALFECIDLAALVAAVRRTL